MSTIVNGSDFLSLVFVARQVYDKISQKLLRSFLRISNPSSYFVFVFEYMTLV